MKIWKEEFEVAERQILAIPAGSIFLDAQIQDRKLMIWFQCDSDEPAVPRKIAIYGTGPVIPDNPGKYIVTVPMGVFIWHIYDLGET